MHAKRVEYVPGVGIDTRRFSENRKDAGEKRRELGFRQEDFLILTVAEMTKNKNHSTVLKALALLKDEPEFAGMHYLICGMGAQKENLRREAADLQIASHVHFLGYRKDVPQIYGCSDLFVFMSYREGLPVALMEAMSSGLPTVCSPARGNTDLIENGKEGIIVSQSPRMLADAILELYRDPEKRQRFGQAAVQKVQPFDAENVRKEMRRIYFG